MTKEAVLFLKNSHIHVALNENNMRTEKNIAYSDISRLFENRGNTTSDYLPGEYGVQRYATSRDKELYLYTEPPRVVETKYSIGGHMHKNQFVCPALAWFVMLRKRGNTYEYLEGHVFAMKGSILTGKETLYRAPFSNVYNDHRICWGNNVVLMPSIKAIQGLSTLFFNAPFNNDLDSERFRSFDRKLTGGQAIKTVHLQMEIGKMLETGTPQEALDFTESKMISTDTTVDEFFNYRIRNF